MRRYIATIVNITHFTPEILELVVILDQKVTFVPGQFMQFEVAPNVYRAYSVISLPSEMPTLRFCIKLEPEGVGSDYVRTLRMGDTILMRGALGTFVVTNYDRDITLIANGVGIAPYCSIVPQLLQEGYAHKLRLIFGVRTLPDLVYTDMFTALAAEHPNFEFIPLLTRPHEGWQRGQGRVTAHMAEQYDQYKSSLFYLCGSLAMVQDMRAVLVEKGVVMTDIKLEIFS